MLPLLPRSESFHRFTLVTRRTKLLPIVGLLLAAVARVHRRGVEFEQWGARSYQRSNCARTGALRPHSDAFAGIGPHFSSSALQITVVMCDDTYGIASAQFRMRELPGPGR